jgi:hypothetical protein
MADDHAKCVERGIFSVYYSCVKGQRIDSHRISNRRRGAASQANSRNFLCTRAKKYFKRATYGSEKNHAILALLDQQHPQGLAVVE